MVRRVALALLISACRISGDHYFGDDDAGGSDANGGDDDVPVVSHSGTRLEVISMSFAGGTVAPVGIHDSMLDTDCSPESWSDGSSYCTPTTGTIVYSDSACTQPLVEPWAPNTIIPDPLFGSTTQPRVGGYDVTHLYRAGNEVTVGQAYFDNGGTCTPTGAAHVFEVVAEVLPAQLVATTVSTEDPGAMSYRYIHGADGLQTITPSELHDNGLPSDCYVGVQGGSYPTMYCVPLDVGYSAAYSDPACTKPIVDYQPDIPRSYAAVFPPPNACFEISTLHELGSIVTPPQTYAFDMNTGVCTAHAGTGASYYQAAPDPIQLPPLVHRPANQPGRRIENAVRTVGSQRFTDYDFYDTELATWCSVRLQPDESYVCVPEGGSTTSLFDDAACTHPISVIEVPRQLQYCGFPIPPYAIETIGTSTNVRPVVLTQPGLLYRKTTSCVPFQGINEVYSVGDPLPIAKFATATVVTEPTR